jgi:hypothetical protein
MWKTKRSNRLFFYEYPYKISIKVGGAGALREGMDKIMSLPDRIIQEDNRTKYIAHINYKNDQIRNKQSLIKIGLCVFSFDDVKLRIEGSTCNVFIKQADHFEAIKKELGQYIYEVYVPADDDVASFLTDNPHHIVVNDLPYDNMRYRLHFSSTKKVDKAIANKFLDWASKLSDNSIHMPLSLLKDLREKHHPNLYLYGRYFYVKDEKLASMVHMWFPDLICRTDKYVCKSDIAGK